MITLIGKVFSGRGMGSSEEWKNRVRTTLQEEVAYWEKLEANTAPPMDSCNCPCLFEPSPPHSGPKPEVWVGDPVWLHIRQSQDLVSLAILLG